MVDDRKFCLKISSPQCTERQQSRMISTRSLAVRLSVCIVGSERQLSFSVANPQPMIYFRIKAFFVPSRYISIYDSIQDDASVHKSLSFCCK